MITILWQWLYWSPVWVLWRIFLPIVITLHVLLTKRDTSAAVGWIGACWLMPLVGAVLYVMLGINRVHRRAQKMMDEDEGLTYHPPVLDRWRHRAEEAFQPLSHMLDKVTERPLLGKNRLTCIHDGDNAYPLMLEAIRQARESVLLCSYIFRSDSLGQQFIAALGEAHERGVSVRVLVDGIGSGYFFCGVQHRLRRKGIACARFMHSFLPWRMALINLRNHRKILVVDGRIGFMGGLNIGAENLLVTPLRSFMPVSDTHFRLEGPVVHQLAEAFARDWAFTTGETLTGSRYFPIPEERGRMPARIVTSGPDADIQKIEYTMLQALILARRQVCCMTPYFIPDGRFATELGLAALRGVEVNIVVPRRSNHAVIDYARDACLRRLVDVGCHIWLGSAPFNHSKLMVVDNYWSFVGSANLDARSLRLNFEINMEVHDVALARQLEAFIGAHYHHLLRLEEIDSWHFFKRVRDAAVRLFSPYL